MYEIKEHVWFTYNKTKEDIYPCLSGWWNLWERFYQNLTTVCVLLFVNCTKLMHTWLLLSEKLDVLADIILLSAQLNVFFYEIRLAHTDKCKKITQDNKNILFFWVWLLVQNFKSRLSHVTKLRFHFTFLMVFF